MTNNEMILQGLLVDPEAALNEVFRKNRALIKRVVSDRLHPRLHARIDPSDVVQETLIEAFRRLGEYISSPSLPFVSWLIALADQQTLLALRRHVLAQKRSVMREAAAMTDHSEARHFLDQAIAGDLTDPELHLIKLERWRRIRQAIDLLSPDTQEVIRMRYLEEKSLAEIAERLGITVDAVAKRAMRGLRRLTGIVAEMGLTDT
jgi:RNA polymerase sigma-70 factor (ECF subfamily)